MIIKYRNEEITMYYSEFKEEVEKLSRKYHVGGDQSNITVYYSVGRTWKTVVTIAKNLQYSFKRHVSSSNFNKLPFGRKLYMLSSELAVTPVLERDEGLKEVAGKRKQEHVMDSLTRHIARQARVTQHIANSPAGVNQGVQVSLKSNKKEYTGIKDVLGNKIFVGDTVSEIRNQEDAYNQLKSLGYLPKFDKYEKINVPFRVEKDSYLYGHWIARDVASGNRFGVNGWNFGKDLIIV